MIAGIILCIAALGALCVLLYNFAVYMLPAYVGLAVAFWAIHTGAGVIGGMAVGLFTGGAVFGAGHVAFTMARSHIVRWLIAIAFAVPATLAGFGIMTELWDLFMPPAIWRDIFGVVSASATGLTAIARTRRRVRATIIVRQCRTASRAAKRVAKNNTIAGAIGIIATSAPVT